MGLGDRLEPIDRMHVQEPPQERRTSMGKKEQFPAGSLSGYVIKIWAQALFCSPIRSSGRVDAGTVCSVVAEEILHHVTVPGGISGAVAQWAGDYPELFAERMAWCREQATHAYEASCDECQST
jgi:hypothetical protein